MRGTFGVMAAAVATVVVAAWRRVQREGLDAPRRRRLPVERAGEATRATIGSAATPPVSGVRRGAEPADAIRIVRRGAGQPETAALDAERTEPVRAEPADSIRIVRRSSGPSRPSPATRVTAGSPEASRAKHTALPGEPAPREAARAEPARAESFRARTAGPVRPQPLGPLDEEPAGEGEQAEPPAPFPAEAPERGREEPGVPPVAWDGGSAPLPARVPRPTFWPAVLALGVTLAAWGAISTPLVIFGGLAVVVVALAFWIREMTHAD